MIDPVFCAYPCVKAVTDLGGSVQIVLNLCDFETFVSRMTIASTKGVLLTVAWQGASYNTITLTANLTEGKEYPPPYKSDLVEALNAIASVEAIRKHT